MANATFPIEKKRLLGLVAVLGFGLTAMFAVLSLEFLVAPTFVLSYFVLLPLIAILGEDFPLVASDDESAAATAADTTDATDPVDRLRERYANGEIDEAEFERKLDRLLETEDLERRAESRERSLELE